MLDFSEVADLSAFEPTRSRVREFLAREISDGSFVPWQVTWTTFDRAFSRRAGDAGFVGMVLPQEYGGHARSALERYVVVEEMLAAGAPCGAHWIADRQSAPQILHHGSERAKREILPRIARGECAFGIGMSEPDSGSDLAGVRTRAVKVEGGWRINGTKVWTTNAHQVDYLITLVRTSDEPTRKHGGLTQMITEVDPARMSIRPILDLSGHHEFNEVHFDNYFIPDDMVLGEPGSGWSTVTAELSFERSGPDRFLSAWQLLQSLVDAVGHSGDRHQRIQIGRLVAHAATLRRMSTVVAGLLDQGKDPKVEAAMVKHLGTSLEREIPEIARLLLDRGEGSEPMRRFDEALRHITLIAPSFTLRGGTREIMRGVIARGLGLR